MSDKVYFVENPSGKTTNYTALLLFEAINEMNVEKASELGLKLGTHDLAWVKDMITATAEERLRKIKNKPRPIEIEFIFSD